METALTDYRRIFECEEDPNRTAVIITPYGWRMNLDYGVSYFEPYGVVETTRSGFNRRSFYMVIQFKDAKDAVALIAKRCILLGNDAFKVMSFHSNDELMKLVEDITFTHPPYYAPPPPDRLEDNILNILNDDCLCELFKRTDLSESKRIQIENTCTRFKRVTEKALISVYKRNEIDFTKLNPDGKVTLTEIENFLHHFWPSVVSVDLSEDNYAHMADKFDSILKLMAKYCLNLRRLGLHFRYRNNMKIENETLTEIRPLLSKLNSFSISHRLLSDCNAFITACHEIETLSVSFNEPDSVLPKMKFSKLKTCWFIDVNSNILEGFLSQNPQIEKISFSDHFDALLSISRNVPNVRELDISGISTRLTNIDNLHFKSLKQAKISMRFGNSEFLLDNSIENLSKNITNLYLPFKETIDFSVIIELTKHLYNLETLEINLSNGQHIVSIDQLKDMLSFAKKMTELRLMSIVYVFYEKYYNEILEIVKKRSNHPLKLNIELDNKGYITSGNKKIFFNAQPQWLTITNCY